MTRSALGRTCLRSADTRLHVAGCTRRYGMSRNQVKPHRDIPGGRLHRFPARQAVAALTIRSERGRVRVAVASAAAPGDVRSDWSPVVVTPKTGGARMGRLQAISGLFLMVEGQVSSHDLPTVSNVADAAIARERLVRRDGAPLPVPVVLRCAYATTENDYGSGHDERPPKEQSQFSNTAHGSPGITQAQFKQRRVHIIPIEVRGPAEQAPPAGDASIEADRQITQ